MVGYISVFDNILQCLKVYFGVTKLVKIRLQKSDILEYLINYFKRDINTKPLVNKDLQKEKSFSNYYILVIYLKE